MYKGNGKLNIVLRNKKDPISENKVKSLWKCEKLSTSLLLSLFSAVALSHYLLPLRLASSTEPNVSLVLVNIPHTTALPIQILSSVALMDEPSSSVVYLSRNRLSQLKICLKYCSQRSGQLRRITRRGGKKSHFLLYSFLYQTGCHKKSLLSKCPTTQPP